MGDYYSIPEEYTPIFMKEIAPYASVIAEIELRCRKFLFQFDPHTKSYHNDIEGNGVICSAVDILPTEFPKDASQHFGNVLLEFIGYFASTKDFTELHPHLKNACIVHRGALPSFYEFIPHVRDSTSNELPQDLPDSNPNKKMQTQEETLARNEAMDIMQAYGINLLKKI